MTRDDELLGLSEYEGRVYRALLMEHPATAYRLGKRSGVPLSRVYEIADRLVQKGAASRLDGEPARYAPAPPDSLVEAARSRVDRRLAALADELASLTEGTEEAAPAWLRGEAAVLERTADVIGAARASVLVAADAGALRRLHEALDACAPRVHVRAVSLPQSARASAGLLVLADSQVAVIGRLGPAADALVTRHSTVVRLCDEYFRLRSVADAAQDMLAARRSPQRSLDQPAGWLGWEEEKHRRLLQTH